MVISQDRHYGVWYLLATNTHRNIAICLYDLVGAELAIAGLLYFRIQYSIHSGLTEMLASHQHPVHNSPIRCYVASATGRLDTKVFPVRTAT